MQTRVLKGQSSMSWLTGWPSNWERRLEDTWCGQYHTRRKVVGSLTELKGQSA